MDNTNRNVFGLNGITGMLIATVLLLSILVGLTIWGISAQQEVANTPYEITTPQAIKMIDSANSDLMKK
jgi:16S rRNA A1518/A1519 N6-dimethyltransferase RsmA/KsgA/DIM1 with predicted DNA glycosylase/AP lyase activity